MDTPDFDEFFDDMSDEETEFVIQYLVDHGAASWAGYDEDGERLFHFNIDVLKDVMPELYDQVSMEIDEVLLDLFEAGLADVEYDENLEATIHVTPDGLAVLLTVWHVAEPDTQWFSPSDAPHGVARLPIEGRNVAVAVVLGPDQHLTAWCLADVEDEVVARHDRREVLRVCVGDERLQRVRADRQAHVGPLRHGRHVTTDGRDDRAGGDVALRRDHAGDVVLRAHQERDDAGGDLALLRPLAAVQVGAAHRRRADDAPRHRRCRGGDRPATGGARTTTRRPRPRRG